MDYMFINYAYLDLSDYFVNNLRFTISQLK